jgi:hypothetical protein
VDAWIAFGAYPWNWCPILEHQADKRRGFSFGVDDQGRIGLYVGTGRRWVGSRSESTIPLRTWAYVAATYHREQGIRLYVNGEPAGQLSEVGRLAPATGGTAWVGKNPERLRQTFGVRGDEQHMKANILFDGIVDELKIRDGALSGDELAVEFDRHQPERKVAIAPRRLPAGPAGTAPFGAVYTRLPYYKGWDDLWRIGDTADVLVRFDHAPVRYVFWRGTSYIPHWVTETGIWYNNEFNETWGDHGCHEPMSDKQCRYSHVRIIENHDARVVIHWRYALADITYGLAKIDPLTGWGDWTDEVHTLYPDGVGTREVTLHSTDPESPHEWHEGIVVMGPDFSPAEALEPGGLTLANIDGEHRTYSWGDRTPPDRPEEPANACLQIINTKSRYRPFTAARPVDKPWFDVYAGEIRREVSIYPWWNHWPTAFQPSDGRYAQAADRASHSSLTHIHWEAIEQGKNFMTKVLLHGMTDQSVEHTVNLARSWAQPAALELESGGFTEARYDPLERAYRVRCQRPSTLVARLLASSRSPLINPAVVVQGWGEKDARLELNGERVAVGPDYRRGHRHSLEGTDLVIWTKISSQEPVTLRLEPH